ncbi:hypothetical protein NEF87_000042 [Candidatus Lokiarchaeum ossiferum]|uniref:Glycoside hydrolase family 57 N-terminal domain-containing protein n=1 Tax=Candidatus Lokiarchaeum ossiferum TaxID=2951803 RepID=A0ABY6HJP9_9ARCH|nr:hypothetical protein NEF87_000042 [Candidatus Lokiarchaeum sp. B-35]
MDYREKRIYFVMSPHINYYHSFRGDSIGTDGFGLDIQIMENLVKMVEGCENQGLCHGKIPISWDYSDLFWTIQLQKKFQPEVLDQVIRRCKDGKDEVILGTWGNSILPGLDTEELIQQSKWLHNNQMGIGLDQLFQGRVAPYIRTQETMFTQGMIEVLYQLGVKGILNYYTVIPFDTARPFLNPPLDWNQRYNPLHFHSNVSDAQMLMIPMYGFGETMDHLSVGKWLKKIRKHQKSGEIPGHALVVLNHDMDSYTWNGTHLPKILQWMPNIGGISEIIQAVDKLSYVQFTTLLDIIPQLTPQGNVTLHQDVADGCFNGYYNWAQKFDNTRYWTIGQQARWFKSATDTLIADKICPSTPKTHSLIRSEDDREDSYIKNKILFASTTNFGMSMPFNHPHRQKTALKYGINAFKAAELAFMNVFQSLFHTTDGIPLKEDHLLILPITHRGASREEQKIFPPKLLIDSSFSPEINSFFDPFIEDPLKNLWIEKSEEETHVQFVLSTQQLTQEGFFFGNQQQFSTLVELKESDSELHAESLKLQNEFFKLQFDPLGKISSFSFQGQEFAAPRFLDSSLSFGKKNAVKSFTSQRDQILVLEDGSNGFCASVQITSEFPVEKNKVVITEKNVTVYHGLPQLFVSVSMKIPEINGSANSDSNVYSVKVPYDDRWQEIIPCEIRPGFLGQENYLRIWKHNFLGRTTSFDLDLQEVDSINGDVDCFVGNISDGWMAVSNRKQGLLVGFNSLKAANFAFSPIKWKKNGFGDLPHAGQQIRINPFGTYFGKMLHHWGTGTGHAQKIIPSYSSTFKSTAPTFSGKNIRFDLVINPYFGDKPQKVIQAMANHYSLPPLIVAWNGTTQKISHNFGQIQAYVKNIIKEYDITSLLEMSYLEWVEKINENHIPENKRRDDLNLSVKHLITLFIDGIRSKF